MNENLLPHKEKKTCRFLFLKAYQLIRRYFKFARTEIEKDELLEEISFLNQKTVELIDEKNKI